MKLYVRHDAGVADSSVILVCQPNLNAAGRAKNRRNDFACSSFICGTHAHDGAERHFECILEARHRRSWQWTEPAPAASQCPTEATVDNERRQRRDLASSARLRRSSGIAAVIDRVIRGCAQQGAL